MVHTDEDFARAVEAAVSEIEAATDAELVVVAAERSGSYDDVAYGLASGASLLALAALVYMPWTIAPHWLLVDLVGVWALSAWVCRSRGVRALVVPRARQERQVAVAAAHEFHAEAVHGTPNRTGVLVYISALEGRVELVPDFGIEGRIAPSRWADAHGQFDHDDVEHFVAGLRAVGALLAEYVPKLDHDGIDLPNAPRIRS